ncbi:cbb3-type cytochrome c oxidase subunit I [Paenibacillus sp. MBLB2552]|uniref:Cbb3-type cytochrome c oxidase subunit I n=1 Tax=Paenibacillus mellifer TaxID=2937794 RepID=A0A9X1XZ97_9BACL|nr:cbb3-type cytochrome c oxidase subunit I [Paenibacillus mellifer]MCK8488460.1 cbb3-type cytochrome c oxidase subunit I [Paenibacillus mellifer]
MPAMSRLPFLFIVTGIFGFVLFHATSLMSLTGWIGDDIRGPAGWFQVHLFVLGWATMLAMGAVYQLINVILQSNLYSERLGYIHYALFTVGLFGLLFGFIQGDTYWIGGFATIAFSGIVLFVWNMAATLLRAGTWNAITIGTACAVLYLLLTGLSGMAMGINFATGLYNDLHENLFGTHIWLGTLGWFGLLITGFSYKLLPMFYLSHDYPTRLEYVVLGLWNAGVLLGATSFLFGLSAGYKVAALLLIVLAVLCYNVHLLQIRSKRHKRSPGAGIEWTVTGSQIFAIFSVVFAIRALVSPEHLLDTHTVLMVGWVYLSCWVSFTVLGYMSKIVPFLWWTHKYGKQAGRPGTPLLADLLDERKANFGLILILCANLTVLVGLILGSQVVIATGGALLSIVSVAYITLIALVFAH